MKILRIIYVLFTIAIIALAFIEMINNYSIFTEPYPRKEYNLPYSSYPLLTIWFYLTGFIFLFQAHNRFKKKNKIWIFFLVMGLFWLFATRYIVIFFMMLIIGPTA